MYDRLLMEIRLSVGESAKLQNMIHLSVGESAKLQNMVHISVEVIFSLNLLLRCSSYSSKC